MCIYLSVRLQVYIPCSVKIFIVHIMNICQHMWHSALLFINAFSQWHCGTWKDSVIIGYDISLSRIQCQTIFWTNVDILSFRPSGTSRGIDIQLWKFLIRKIYLKMSYEKYRPFCPCIIMLNQWCRVTHICASNLDHGLDNGLSPVRRQASIWTNAAILSIRPQGAYSWEIVLKTQNDGHFVSASMCQCSSSPIGCVVWQSWFYFSGCWSYSSCWPCPLPSSPQKMMMLHR